MIGSPALACSFGAMCSMTWVRSTSASSSTSKRPTSAAARRYDGWSTHYVRESRVVHIGAASTGLKKKGRRMPQYWFDSRQHYFRKNYGPTYLTLSDLLFTVAFSLWCVRRRLQNKPDLDPPALLGDFVRHSVRTRLAPPPIG